MKTVFDTRIPGKELKYNIKNWKKKKGQNILFITGVSGSGKTTLANKLANDKDINIIHTDQWMYEIRDKKVPKLEGIVDEDMFRNIKAAVEVAKTDYDTLYIIEGIMLYFLSEERIEELEIPKFPIIVTDCSFNTVIESIRTKERKKGRDSQYSRIVHSDFIERYLLLSRFIDKVEEYI